MSKDDACHALAAEGDDHRSFCIAEFFGAVARQSAPRRSSLIAFCCRSLARQKVPRWIEFEKEPAAPADRQAVQAIAARPLLAEALASFEKAAAAHGNVTNGLLPA